MGKIDAKKLKALNDKVYKNGGVDRMHLLEFLESINTSDGKELIKQVKGWLTDLHNDPKYSKVNFPEGDIDAIIGDLDSYGRLQPETILAIRQHSAKQVPAS